MIYPEIENELTGHEMGDVSSGCVDRMEIRDKEWIRHQLMHSIQELPLAPLRQADKKLDGG